MKTVLSSKKEKKKKEKIKIIHIFSKHKQTNEKNNTNLKAHINKQANKKINKQTK